MANLAYDYETLEGGDASEEEYFVAMQGAINAGAAWKFQGSVGRSMMDSIKSGCCMLGLKGAYDYYGNYIPSRFEVKGGTKGSYGFVEEANGAEWADMMKEVPG
jgi:hypothetical protein